MLLSWDYSPFGPLAFQGHTWIDRLCEGFIEVVRRDGDFDEADALLTTKSLLIDEGRSNGSSIPQSIGEMRFEEFIHREYIGTASGADVITVVPISTSSY
ncbi:hypothetical protein V1517DRAFT_324260 [Lipomyces orientalis]|uniref:Uncharacterized protein n=1 Tax=Lipomyces orientalis TaxID=1233043 RepID=A0ACC3TM21_9ASCO